MARDTPRVDFGALAALTWLAFAVLVTVVFGPLLGLRGWAWLGLHHLLCVVGCTHELRRAQQRKAARARDALERIRAGQELR